eukprot:c15676_g1_i1.p1 GENE.c15676_g1_i1~~c15676_g1_i1.p1  ORF type:complete len:517 (-),score=159.63 c15676_g1_i1:306-1856(-)
MTTEYFDDHLSISSHNSSFMLFDDDIFFEHRLKSDELNSSFKLASIANSEIDPFAFSCNTTNSGIYVDPSNTFLSQQGLNNNIGLSYQIKVEPVEQFEPNSNIIQEGKEIFSHFLNLISHQQLEESQSALHSELNQRNEEDCSSYSSSSGSPPSSSPPSPVSSNSCASTVVLSSVSPISSCVSSPSISPASTPMMSPSELRDLNETPNYFELWLESQEEIKKLKKAIEDITNKITQLEDHSSSNDQISIPSTPIQSPEKTTQVEPPALCLRVCSEFQRTWYTDRAFPAFTVGLFDSNNLQPYLDVSGWRVVVSLIDGHGKDASAKFCGSSGSAPLSFAISRGRSVINGIRFSSVSSKNGGCFQLVMRVVNPFAAELPSPKLNEIEYLSEPIQILSYRLFHVPKLESDMLFPSDPLWKVKGIGPLYAKRFSELGIATVKDLASIDLESLTEDEVRNYVNSLRRDRGALTPAKLFEYVSQAREVVARDAKLTTTTGQKHERGPDIDSSIAHPAKRIRV